MAEPRAVVEAFFDRMASEDRRESVGELFADDAVITLPGARFDGPDAPREMLAFLAPRYQRVDKAFDRWVEADDVVISQGTLFGVNNDDVSFDGVRFVDIYRVVDGRIRRLDVYNDLAAEGVL